MVKIDFEGGSYQFLRDVCTGEGRWFCIKGNVPGIFGSVNENVVVPIIFGNTLSSVARSMGFKKELIARHLPSEDNKKEKRKAVRVARKKKQVGISLDF
jgi:hypothetical protein